MKYTVVYRKGEFEAEVEAENTQQAIKKFKSRDCEIKRGQGELWEEYIEVEEKKMSEEEIFDALNNLVSAELANFEDKEGVKVGEKEDWLCRSMRIHATTGLMYNHLLNEIKKMIMAEKERRKNERN